MGETVVGTRLHWHSHSQRERIDVGKVLGQVRILIAVGLPAALAGSIAAPPSSASEDSSSSSTFIDSSEVATGTLAGKVEIIPMLHWGKFVPALNALVGAAADHFPKADTLLLQSLEVAVDAASMEALRSHFDIKRDLVVGAALPGHEFQPNPATQPVELSGLTSPWNTLALWNLEQLTKVGFALMGDALRLEVDGIGSAAGIEEVATIAMYQQLYANSTSPTTAKLVRVPSIAWQVDGLEDPKRLEWHQKKMASKLQRAAAQIAHFGVAPGRVHHLEAMTGTTVVGTRLHWQSHTQYERPAATATTITGAPASGAADSISPTSSQITSAFVDSVREFMTELQNEVATGLLAGKVEIVPMLYWGKFVPALNALVGTAADHFPDADTLLLQSLEIEVDAAGVALLRSNFDPEHDLVVGTALPGHAFQPDPAVQPLELSGLTSPWNTLALWNLQQLTKIGFALMGDALRLEVEGIGPAGAPTRAKLIRVPGVVWQVADFKDPERVAWHTMKMRSKKQRTAAQMAHFGGVAPGRPRRQTTLRRRMNLGDGIQARAASLREEATRRWLVKDELVFLLLHCKLVGVPVLHSLQLRPPSGSLLFYNTLEVSDYKKDGWHWQKRKDKSGRVREDRAKLVINREVIILGTYVHSAETSASPLKPLSSEETVESIMKNCFEMDFEPLAISAQNSSTNVSDLDLLLRDNSMDGITTGFGDEEVFNDLASAVSPEKSASGLGGQQTFELAEISDFSPDWDFGDAPSSRELGSVDIYVCHWSESQYQGNIQLSHKKQFTYRSHYQVSPSLLAPAHGMLGTGKRGRSPTVHSRVVVDYKRANDRQTGSNRNLSSYVESDLDERQCKIRVVERFGRPIALDDCTIEALSDNDLEQLSEKLLERVVHQLVTVAHTSEELLEELNSLDETGLSLLHYVSFYNYSQLVPVLVAHGAHINQQSTQGQTALHLAAGCGHNEVVDVLLQSGADLQVRDFDKLTPADRAEKSGHTDVASKLRHHMGGDGAEDLEVVDEIYGFGGSPMEIDDAPTPYMDAGDMGLLESYGHMGPTVARAPAKQVYQRSLLHTSTGTSAGFGSSPASMVGMDSNLVGSRLLLSGGENDSDVQSVIAEDEESLTKLQAAMELMGPEEKQSLEDEVKVLQHGIRAWLLKRNSTQSIQDQQKQHEAAEPSELSERERAAVTVQAATRSMLARRSFLQTKHVAIKFQAATRGVLCRKNFARMKAHALASLVIQRNVREWWNKQPAASRPGSLDKDADDEEEDTDRKIAPISLGAFDHTMRDEEQRDSLST
uniref:CG-1 domain-containing protein n=1 Tax=Phytophthora ramorum TaxID=164328 RepID=H3HAL9_PHYRM